MRTLSLTSLATAVAAALLLSGCASPIPTPNPQLAWIEPQPAPDDELLIERVGDTRTPDGRYAEVAPGSYSLSLLYNFTARFGLVTNNPKTLSCQIRFSPYDYAAGKRYYVRGSHDMGQPTVTLHNAQGDLLATGRSTCL